METSDIKLIQLLKDKYNVPLNDIDCIQMCHMQLVINTVREFDKNTGTCEHGKGLTDYCLECGRIHGGL